MDINDPIPKEWHELLDFFLTTPRCRKVDAYKHVYGADTKNASPKASTIWRDPRFNAEMQRRLNPVKEQNALKVEQILHHLHSVATADVRDLTEIRRVPCRCCWGLQFKYQRRPSEFEAALALYRLSDAGKEDVLGLGFDVQGGVGYTTKKPPNPDCPECDGEGKMQTFAKDMRNLTKAQAELIQGVKETENGLEVKTRDKTKIIELAMRNLGMLTTDKGDDENSKIPPAGKVTWAVEDGDKDPKA